MPVKHSVRPYGQPSLRGIGIAMAFLALHFRGSAKSSFPRNRLWPVFHDWDTSQSRILGGPEELAGARFRASSRWTKSVATACAVFPLPMIGRPELPGRTGYPFSQSARCTGEDDGLTNRTQARQRPHQLPVDE